jgi:hypothetical protein
MPRYRVVYAQRLLEFYQKEIEAASPEEAREIAEADEAEGLDETWHLMPLESECLSADIARIEEL